ncbi:hypothetical protein [Nocardia callitridis]|uniref:Uncharacterized protein n=1 Tax=Nocardia callitridis TaxID=648753 RepID=A0ABP9KEF9_9NOCA
MVQPTPWRVNEARLAEAAAASPGETTAPPGATTTGVVRKRLVRPQVDFSALRSVLRRDWGYFASVFCGVLTLVLLFQPWLAVAGPDGKARVNAFGRIHATTAYLNVWSSHRPPAAQITGVWAIMASVAIVVSIFAVTVNARRRTETLVRLSLVSILASTGFVVTCLLYINAKGPALKRGLGRTSDFGGQVGALMNWAFGDGPLVVPGIQPHTYTTSGLTQWAMISVVVSVASSVAAIAQWASDGGASDIKIRFRLRSPLAVRSSDGDRPEPKSKKKPKSNAKAKRKNKAKSKSE